MKKIFVIFLTIIIVLCSFNVVVAQENSVDPVSGIREQLDNIEVYLNRYNPDKARLCLLKLREYVYDWSSQLSKEGLYTQRVISIIDFASMAIEENNVDYVGKARSVLEEILSGKPIEIVNSHS